MSVINSFMYENMDMSAMPSDEHGVITGYSRVINGKRVYPRRDRVWEAITMRNDMPLSLIYVDKVEGVVYTARDGRDSSGVIIYAGYDLGEVIGYAITLLEEYGEQYVIQ